MSMIDLDVLRPLLRHGQALPVLVTIALAVGAQSVVALGVIDQEQLLIAARLLGWTTLAAWGAAMSVLVAQRCEWRYWETAIDRQFAGGAVLTLSLAVHQAWWWAHDFATYAGRCDDTQRITLRHCETAWWLKAHAAVVTTNLYWGIALAAMLAIPGLLVTIGNWREGPARIATKGWIVAMLAVGVAVIWGR